MLKCPSSFHLVPTCSYLVQNRNAAAALPSLKLYSFRRRIAEKLSNKFSYAHFCSKVVATIVYQGSGHGRFDEKRVDEVGPDLACLEWLMQCGSTKVEMSDSQVIQSQREMNEYLKYAISLKKSSSELKHGDLAFEKAFPTAPPVYIVNVDASDSAIANPGFQYFTNVKSLKSLKMNFCDYFGDDAIRYLALGRPSKTLEEIEIVLNPCITDAAVYWMQRLKSLKRAHFYFLPYVAHRQGFLRQMKLALPRCNVTFPEVDKIGYGYEEEKGKKKK